jgi:hypothetical protein
MEAGEAGEEMVEWEVEEMPWFDFEIELSSCRYWQMVLSI